MKKLMRFFLPAALLATSVSLYASNHQQEIFKVQPNFSTAIVTLNSKLALRRDYDASFSFSNASPTGYTLFANTIGIFEAQNFGPSNNQNRQSIQFRLCSNLRLGVICDQLTSNASTNYTPAVIYFTGGPQTITGNFCLGPGDTSCENHTFTTRPAIQVATATGISAAFQAADNAAAKYKTFDAATSVSNSIAIARHPCRGICLVMAGTSSADFRVTKFDIDAHTAGLTNPQPTTLNLGAFTTVTDMALSPDGFTLYLVCDGMPYYAHIDSDGNFTSQLQPLKTTGDTFTSLKYLTNTPAGNAAVAVSPVDAAMYSFEFTYAADGTPSASVTRIAYTGTAPPAPGKPAVYAEWQEREHDGFLNVMVPSGNSVFIGMLNRYDSGIGWSQSIVLDAPVNVVSAPITAVEYFYDPMTLSVQSRRTFLVGFETAPSAAVGTFAAVTTWDDYDEFKVRSATEAPVAERVDFLRTL